VVSVTVAGDLGAYIIDAVFFADGRVLGMRTHLENVLISLDIGGAGALLRMVLGVLLVAVVEAAHPETGLWMLSALLLGMLFAIKLVAAAARLVVPASPRVRSHWEWRRTLARYYDSYQWRKLLWYGVGIMMGGALAWPATSAQWILGIACTVAGGVAEALWRRHGRGLAPSHNGA
jgi:hypothetical protein